MPMEPEVSAMSSIIRRATADDVMPWIDLLLASLGGDYVAREIYDPIWVASQLDAGSGSETWIVEEDGRILAAGSILPPNWPSLNPICNIGRVLIREESYEDGTAEGLFDKLRALADERGQTIVTRVAASDNAQQLILEQLGFVCAGYQPIKHLVGSRAAMLFYTRPSRSLLGERQTVSESLSQISELSIAVLTLMGVPPPHLIRDGVTGYPLTAETSRPEEVTFEDYKFCRAQLRQKNPTVEISGGFHLGFGLMRVEVAAPIRALLARANGKTTAGMAFYFDEHDRGARLVDSFCVDDASIGGLFQQAVCIAQETFQAVYVEVDLLANAPRILKTAEQVGFVPVAYLPAFYCHNGRSEDVIKMVKINVPYDFEGGQFTTQANTIAAVVDRCFEDMKVGMATVGLLRGLPIFSGLGDGELRKMARLFRQRLYRQGETIFARNQPGDEAFVVMRGEVEILLDEDLGPVANLGPGKIIGELAFLDGAPRTAKAVAKQASILLVLHRDAFNRLIASEPHLGMHVMRNIAVDLSSKLRQTNGSLLDRR
jgi:CRP/FNR family transcriptional regulator, cyclic AMP receptor protein